MVSLLSNWIRSRLFAEIKYRYRLNSRLFKMVERSSKRLRLKLNVTKWFDLLIRNLLNVLKFGLKFNRWRNSRNLL